MVNKQTLLDGPKEKSILVNYFIFCMEWGKNKWSLKRKVSLKFSFILYIRMTIYCDKKK